MAAICVHKSLIKKKLTDGYRGGTHLAEIDRSSSALSVQASSACEANCRSAAVTAGMKHSTEAGDPGPRFFR